MIHQTLIPYRAEGKKHDWVQRKHDYPMISVLFVSGGAYLCILSEVSSYALLGWFVHKVISIKYLEVLLSLMRPFFIIAILTTT